VDNFGYAAFTSAVTNNVAGVVYPASPNERTAMADLTVTDKAIGVITTFALRSVSEVSGTEFLPDIVIWHGDNFLVRSLEDWTAYGSGFVLALCSSIDLVDAPPQ
jgi:hypothetical protein